MTTPAQLKSFTAHTLNDNWFEDRAPPLKGVLADYGDRSLSTTSKSEMKRPTAHKGYYPPAVEAARRRGPRFGMLTPDTFVEAQISFGDGVSTGHTFGALIQTHPPDVDKADMATTAQVSFGTAKKPTVFEERAMRSTMARTAGVGGPAKARGMQASGAIGEQLKLDADASAHTGVQRSWLYGGDPGIDATVRPPRPAAEATHMSLPITGGGVPDGVAKIGEDGRFVAKGRTAIITAGQTEMNLKRGFRIFNDADE